MVPRPREEYNSLGHLHRRCGTFEQELLHLAQDNPKLKVKNTQHIIIWIILLEATKLIKYIPIKKTSIKYICCNEIYVTKEYTIYMFVIYRFILISGLQDYIKTK